ncbi:MAG: hypothetical protein JWR38_3903 [Mucilaginibacter sp.]|nr:hypothetical protein [Mucilaginibacter sp.]
MKRYLLYLLPLMLLLVEACSTKNDYTAPPAPLGTFQGFFKLLVKKPTGTDYDTVKKVTNLILTISSPNNFKVTGDTATVHAGSRGLFKYDGTYIAFWDSTYKVGPQTKIHLVNTYLYAYSGGLRLQIQRANQAQDSILVYDLNKTSN